MGKQRLKRKDASNKIHDQSARNVEFASERDVIDVINLVDKNFRKQNYSKRG